MQKRTQNFILNLFRAFMELKIRPIIILLNLGGADDKGNFKFIPNHGTKDILFNLLKIKNLLKKKSNPIFVDLGSGLGNIMMLANLAGYHIKGVELDQNYIQLCRNIMYSQAVDFEVFKGNLLDFDYSILKNVDVFYTYNPLSNPELMQQAMNRLIEHMPSGSYLLWYSAGNTVIKGLEQIPTNGHGKIYKKP